MSKPIDFIVFGVPRSGTKTLVRALNLHPQVYCAMERFHFREDHSRIMFPASFLDADKISNSHDLKKVRRIREEIRRKPEARYVGNKLPRYYFSLARINKELPSLKNIWIYRSPSGFMQSWNRRERASWRGRWRTGQIGLFGLLELLCCIENCLNLKKDVFVFPYDQGLNHSTEPIIEALEYLGAAASRYNMMAFKTHYLYERREASHRLPLASYEEEILAALRVHELDSIMDQGKSVMVSQLYRPLREYIACITETLPAAVDRAFAECDNHAAGAFGYEHFRRNRIELRPLQKLAHGSTTLVQFQNFSLYQHLKAIYVQRWALKRRLLSIRIPIVSRAERSISARSFP